MMRSILLLIVLAWVTGCSRPEQAPPVDAGDGVAAGETAAFDTMFDQARTHFHEGNTDAAVDLLTEGLANPEFVENQPTIFRALIELLLIENRVVDAQTNFLAMLHASPDTAVQAFNMIPTHLKRQDDPSAYLSWTAQMVGMELPNAVAESAYSYYMDANIMAGNLDKMPDLAQNCVVRFGGDAAVRIFTRPLNDLVNRGEYAAIRDVLKTLSETAEASAVDFVTAMEIVLAAAETNWDAATTMFKAKAADLAERSAHMAFRCTLDRAQQAARSDVSDALCTYVLASMPDAKRLRRLAASNYIRVAVDAGDHDGVVARTKWLVEAGAAEMVEPQVSKHFYSVMQNASDESKKDMLGIVEQLIASKDSAPDASLQALLMDGAVLCEEYGIALNVLDAGFRADDEAWVAMARNKLSAHLALEEGRTDEAVGRFRDFMKHVETWTEPTSDPSTGISYSREMTLGLNARRIGDIYRDVGRTNEAAKAYAEARAYFEEAQADVEAESKESTYINRQLAEIPIDPAE